MLTTVQVLSTSHARLTRCAVVQPVLAATRLAGAAVERGWAPDVATEDGLRDLVRKIDSAPPAFQRGQEVLAGLSGIKDAGYSGVEEGLALGSQ